MHPTVSTPITPATTGTGGHQHDAGRQGNAVWTGTPHGSPFAEGTMTRNRVEVWDVNYVTHWNLPSWGVADGRPLFLN